MKLKKGVLPKLFVIVITTVLTLIFISYILYLVKNEQKKMIETTKKDYLLSVSKKDIDILYQNISDPTYYESISLVKDFFKNYRFNQYNIREYKGNSEVVFGFLPLNNPQDREHLKTILTQKPNTLFIFFYTFFLGSPDGRCLLPAQDFLKEYFTTQYVEGVKGDECVKGYFSYVNITKLYVYNKEKKSYDVIIPQDPYLKISFLEKNSNPRINPIGVEVNGKFYPLVVDVGKRVIITSKLGINPEIDKIIINYISNKIEEKYLNN